MTTTSQYLARLTNQHELDVSFNRRGETQTILTLLRPKKGKRLVFNKDLVLAISNDAAALVPEQLEIEIENLLFVNTKRTHESKNLLGVTFGGALSLTDLPLVGDRFPKEPAMGVDNFQLWLSSSSFSLEEINAINEIIPLETVVLPSMINKGANYAMRVRMGKKEKQLNLAAAEEQASTHSTQNDGQQSANSTRQDQPEREITQPGLTKWFDVNKQLGPLTIKRAGGRFYEAKLHLMLDTTLKMGPMTVTLDGLSAGSTIAKFDPEYNLDGIGLTYEKTPTRISGYLLRNALDESYKGNAVIKTASLSISALGAYKKLKNTPSLFVYGVVNRSVDVGPPWLNVTGISAGFGYNRKIKVPKAKDVPEFPLVRAAMGHNYGSDPMTVLGNMKRHLPAAKGENCLALGVRFNTFKLVESFALVLVNLAGKPDVDVVGVSTLVQPARSKKPLAVIEMAYKARYDVDEKVLRVDGVLTPASYVFDKKCDLTGSFAFHSWVGGRHAGDFVLSMGGYSPSFKKPKHYPAVPRLELHWNINKHLTLKGNMYYAMVPSGLMAGGRLEALFKIKKSARFDVKILGVKVAGVKLSGEVKASFVMAADFIINWLPYAYEAQMSVGVGIKAKLKGSAYVNTGFKKVRKSVQKNFDLDLSTKLNIWGPEFAGKAHVDWKVVSFDIKFGSQQKPKKKPLSWKQFKEAFLPPSDQVLSISFEDGLVRTLKHGMSIVNPAELVINTNSAIPANKATHINPGPFKEVLQELEACEAALEDVKEKLKKRKAALKKKQDKVRNLELAIEIFENMGFLGGSQEMIKPLEKKLKGYKNDVSDLKDVIDDYKAQKKEKQAEIERLEERQKTMLKPFVRSKSSFGISTMDLSSVLRSYQFIRVLDVDNGLVDVTDRFTFKPVMKNGSKALWGKSAKVKPGRNNLIEDLLMGCSIAPKPKRKPDETEEKYVIDFSYDVELKEGAYKWEKSAPMTFHKGNEAERRNLIQDLNGPYPLAARNALLKSLGLDQREVRLQGVCEDTSQAFLRAPEVIL